MHFDNFIHPEKLLLKLYYILKFCNRKSVFIKLCIWLSFNLILLCFHLNNLCSVKKSVFSCKRNNKDNIWKVP